MIIRTDHRRKTVNIELSAVEAREIGEAMQVAWPLPDVAWHEAQRIIDAAEACFPPRDGPGIYLRVVMR